MVASSVKWQQTRRSTFNSSDHFPSSRYSLPELIGGLYVLPMMIAGSAVHSFFASTTKVRRGVREREREREGRERERVNLSFADARGRDGSL